MEAWPPTTEDAVAETDRQLATLVEQLHERVRIVTFEQFVSDAEEMPEPLLGTAEETLLPQDGMLLMYGDGGAGKTTLTIDAVCHLGAGIDWLGFEVAKPRRVTLIENEGPRGKFRQILAEKAAHWNGAPFVQNVDVLEQPWTRFTLGDEDHRMALAEHVSKTNTDVVVMGPLATLGMIGGGTPDEISAFERLLRLTRAFVQRAFAFWVVHHENKAGDVSGAWERVPDTLAHVQGIGNGHTKLVWRKARWSSANHGRSFELNWTDGRSFELYEVPERNLYEEMLAAFIHADAWRTADEAGKLIGVRRQEARKILAELVRQGSMKYESGPLGRHPNAHCWRLAEGRPSLWDDTGRDGLAGYSGRSSHPYPTPEGGEGGDEVPTESTTEVVPAPDEELDW
jgi:AAA domain